VPTSRQELDENNSPGKIELSKSALYDFLHLALTFSPLTSLIGSSSTHIRPSLRAIDICSKTLGDNHPTTNRLETSFANLLHSMQKITEAKQLDPRAAGGITGSWKAIDLPSVNKLNRLD
jgi:hypothetical protein